MAPRGAALAFVFACVLAAWPAGASAQGKLLLTGGVSSVDGAAGGGLTSWAVTGSYATRGQTGATAFASVAGLPDYGLRIVGLALTWSGPGRSLGGAAGLRHPFHRRRTRPAGPAPEAGHPGAEAAAGGRCGARQRPLDAAARCTSGLGAGGLAATLDAPGAHRSGTDLYLSATKLLLAQGLLVNGTLRATKANQNGLPGFGSLARQRLRLQPELSLALLLSRQLTLGLEYRAMPDRLNPSALGGGLRADDWANLFLAWAPNKHLFLTLAWVDLGRIVPAVQARRQQGAYLSVQGAF